MQGYVKNMVQYLKDVEVEFWKISWPGRDNTVKSTAVVLFVSVLLTAVLALADYVFSTLIGFVLA